MSYAETYEKLATAEAARDKSSPIGAARAAFLQAGKSSLSIRKRTVLPRDDLDERLKAAIDAYFEAL
jgi:hypothetical protein